MDCGLVSISGNFDCSNNELLDLVGCPLSVVGDVNLSGMGLSSIPIKFGIVVGSFVCSENWLSTLEGCPTYVGGNFSCGSNGLKSLKGCPVEISGL